MKKKNRETQVLWDKKRGFFRESVCSSVTSVGKYCRTRSLFFFYRKSNILPSNQRFYIYRVWILQKFSLTLFGKNFVKQWFTKEITIKLI